MATDTPTDDISMACQIPEWKDITLDILLIGHRRMGKSTMIRRVTRISDVNQDVESEPVTFNTNYGKLTMRIDEWDINEYASEDSYKRVEGVIILLGYPYTSKSIIFTDLRTILEDDLESTTHTVFAYNKNDLLQDQAEESVHLISALTGENCLAPFLELARKITGKPDLVFIEPIATPDVVDDESPITDASSNMDDEHRVDSIVSVIHFGLILIILFLGLINRDIMW